MRVKLFAMVCLAVACPYAELSAQEVQREATPMPRCCAPLVVPNEPDGEVVFSPPTVLFDLDGNGQQELVAFPKNGSWLAMDTNHNGVIDDGRELVGQMTGGNRVPTGFESLKIYVHVQDGLAQPDDVLLWKDANFDGISQPEELRPLKEMMSGISLGYLSFENRDQFGTFVWMRGWGFYGEQQKEWSIYVVFPAVRQIDSPAPAAR